jgi:hypothetical protein
MPPSAYSRIATDAALRIAGLVLAFVFPRLKWPPKPPVSVNRSDMYNLTYH